MAMYIEGVITGGIQGIPECHKFVLDAAKTLPISILPLAFVAIYLPSSFFPHYHILMSRRYEILFTLFSGTFETELLIGEDTQHH